MAFYNMVRKFSPSDENSGQQRLQRYTSRKSEKMKKKIEIEPTSTQSQSFIGLLLFET